MDLWPIVTEYNDRTLVTNVNTVLRTHKETSMVYCMKNG